MDRGTFNPDCQTDKCNSPLGIQCISSKEPALKAGQETGAKHMPKMKVISGGEKPGNLKHTVHQNMQHRAVLQLKYLIQLRLHGHRQLFEFGGT